MKRCRYTYKKFMSWVERLEKEEGSNPLTETVTIVHFRNNFDWKVLHFSNRLLEETFLSNLGRTCVFVVRGCVNFRKI